MLTILTGLSEEHDIAKAVADPSVQVLCGQTARDNLSLLVPKSCTAILSFGLFGGLSPDILLGQSVIGDKLTDGDGNVYMPDPIWRRNMFNATHYYERNWYSSGLYNTADDPVERAELFVKTSAHCIDDESLAVATLAQTRGISFGILRTCSDTSKDTVPMAARNATNPDGSSNLGSVLQWLRNNSAHAIGEVVDLIEIAREFQISLNELRTAALAVGPKFQSAS